MSKDRAKAQPRWPTMNQRAGARYVQNFPLPVVRRDAKRSRQLYLAVAGFPIEKVQRPITRRPLGKTGHGAGGQNYTVAGQRLHGAERRYAREYNPCSLFRSGARTRQRSTGSGTRFIAHGGTVRALRLVRIAGAFLADRANAMMKISRRSDRAGAQRAMQAMMGMVKARYRGLKRAMRAGSAP